MQHERELPGREVDRLAERRVLLRQLEDAAQFLRGVVVLLLVGAGDGTPVMAAGQHRRLLRDDQVEQVMRLADLLGCGAVAQQQLADALQAEIEVEQRDDVGLAGELADIQLAMDVP